MPEPSPTPFDITDIPHIAWVPGPSVWAGAFIILAAATVIVLALSRSRQPRRRTGKLLEALVLDLESVSASGTISQADRALLIAKRITTVACEPQCSQMSPNELRQRARASSESAEQELLIALAHLEEVLYQPASALRDSVVVEGLRSLGRLARELVTARMRSSR